MSATLLSELAIVCRRCDRLNEHSAASCASCKEPFSAPATPVRTAPAPTKPAPVAVAHAPTPAARAPTPATHPPAPTAHPAPVRIVVLRGSNPGSAFRVATTAGAGASKGVLLFPDDPFLAALHATFLFQNGKLFVRDEGAPSGTFVKIQAPHKLLPGSCFAAGAHLFRFAGLVAPASGPSPLPYGAPAPGGALFTVEQILEGNRAGRACTRPGPTFTIGRAQCDLTVPNDPLLAPPHCEIMVDLAGAVLRDLKTPDGTFIRLPPGGERPLVAGDCVRFGQQVVQIQPA